MVQIKVNKWNSLVQQVEENRQNILTLSEQPPQFVGKGEWDSGEIYSEGDFITYNGASYFSTQGMNTAHQPDTAGATWWQLVAAKGDPGPQGPTGPAGSGNNVYAHYISFNMNKGGIYNFACVIITDSNTPFTFQTFESYLNDNYPGKNFPCSAMTNTDKFCGFYTYQTAASAIRVFSGSGNSMPPEEFTVDASYVIEFNDQVMP